MPKRMHVEPKAGNAPKVQTETARLTKPDPLEATRAEALRLLRELSPSDLRLFVKILVVIVEHEKDG